MNLLGIELQLSRCILFVNNPLSGKSLSSIEFCGEKRYILQYKDGQLEIDNYKKENGDSSNLFLIKDIHKFLGVEQSELPSTDNIVGLADLSNDVYPYFLQRNKDGVITRYMYPTYACGLIMSDICYEVFHQPIDSKPCVLVIPAMTTLAQRHSYISVARLLNLEVQSVISEVGAIVLNHWNDICTSSNIVVIDLGGNYFKASFVTLDRCVIKVVTCIDSTTWGGNSLIETLACELRKVFRQFDIFVSPNTEYYQQLLNDCEEIMDTLNRQSEYTLQLNAYKEGESHTVSIHPSDLEDLFQNTINHMMERIKETFQSLYWSTAGVKAILTGDCHHLPFVYDIICKALDVEIINCKHEHSCAAEGSILSTETTTTSSCPAHVSLSITRELYYQLGHGPVVSLMASGVTTKTSQRIQLQRSTNGTNLTIWEQGLSSPYLPLLSVDLSKVFNVMERCELDMFFNAVGELTFSIIGMSYTPPVFYFCDINKEDQEKFKLIESTRLLIKQALSNSNLPSSTVSTLQQMNSVIQEYHFISFTPEVKNYAQSVQNWVQSILTL